jgi:hypothetical protein
MTVVAIHQPQYLPWLGYFDKLDRCDVFCLLDTVQYKKNEFQNRNRIKTVDGWQWLTVPVTYRFPQRIYEVGVNQTVDWQRKHLQALKTNYSKAPHFGTYIARFEEFYQQSYEMLADANVACIRLLMDLLGLKSKVVLSSSLQVQTEDPTLRLVEICPFPAETGPNTWTRTCSVVTKLRWSFKTSITLSTPSATGLSSPIYPWWTFYSIVVLKV